MQVCMLSTDIDENNLFTVDCERVTRCQDLRIRTEIDLFSGLGVVKLSFENIGYLFDKA